MIIVLIFLIFLAKNLFPLAPIVRLALATTNKLEARGRFGSREMVIFQQKRCICEAMTVDLSLQLVHPLTPTLWDLLVRPVAVLSPDYMTMLAVHTHVLSVLLGRVG